MSDTLVEALSGTEIVNDILDQIRRKLQTSCNLRDCDSYGQGYSASIKIDLKLYAMDVTQDEFSITIHPKTEIPVSTDEITVFPVSISESIEVPQELNLEAVRERIKEPESLPPANEEAEDSRMPIRLKRKYNKRVGIASLEMTANGGAVEVTE